ncbi:serine/threonine-protein kinase pim-2 isoform X1 [Larimichthys crocea]|uniref:serine/threonine-protein kinase pim-2 isoform X1 n=1 Tax=Larimichthys crocea TaxID=215358 RepID=UPI000F5DC88F|nr:serine/threonine-protein kinase pim-2 isoform X1 [Larimichthys crocea]
MASKSWPKTSSVKSWGSNRQLGRHTDPIIKMSKRRSDESLGIANKRSRRSESPCEGCSQTFRGLSPGSSSSSSTSVYTDAPEMPEESLSRSSSEPELELWLSATSDCDTHTDTSMELGVTTNNIRKLEEIEEPRKRSREIQSPLEGPSHQDCSSDKPRKRSRKTQRPSEGSSQRDCFSEAPRKSSRKTLSPSEGPSHQALSSDRPSTSSPANAVPSNSMAAFEAKYRVHEILGEGGFSVVFSGERKDDNLPVAIKEILQCNVDRIPMLLDGNMTMVPLEVALLLRLKPAESETSAVVTLLDWYDLDNSLILVLERPVPCMTLSDYVNRRQFPMQEHETKIIIKQLVDSLIEIHSKEVFHRDIKTDNILIETASDVPCVRIIDFGCGTFLSGQTYTDEEGTYIYAPPEMFIDGMYQAEPLTVWQLGVVMFGMLHRRLPFRGSIEIAYGEPDIGDGLSVDCQNFLLSCLVKAKEARPTLDMLKNHPWLM